MSAPVAEPYVKCVVWDLDGTIWRGTLLEGGVDGLRDGIEATLAELDARGILSSIASRNDEDAALELLDRFGLREYFLVPQITWGSKAASVARVAELLNVGLDSLVFVDDEPFERDEVRFSLPEVRCYAPASLPNLLSTPAFSPPVTPEARRRRHLYLVQSRRDEAERAFVGPTDEFLESLGMRLVLRRASAGDLRRASELTVRTNQLNTTGRSYSVDELTALSQSSDHLLLVADLEDRYGPYGTIGLALVARERELWTLKLFLLSCRVMGRGVAGVILGLLAASASAAGARLRAEVVPNGRNRLMIVTLRLSGYTVVAESESLLVLESPERAPDVPPYVDVTMEDLEGDARPEPASQAGVAR